MVFFKQQFLLKLYVLQQDIVLGTLFESSLAYSRSKIQLSAFANAQVGRYHSPFQADVGEQDVAFPFSALRIITLCSLHRQVGHTTLPLDGLHLPRTTTIVEDS